MLRAADTDKTCLHLMYEMWDCMIEKVKIQIYQKQHKDLDEESEFFDIVNGILQERWLKCNTPSIVWHTPLMQGQEDRGQHHLHEGHAEAASHLRVHPGRRAAVMDCG